MSKKTKKVVLFLVEGVSEETALGLRMKKYFETNECIFRTSCHIFTKHATFRQIEK